ncbi:MAG: TRAP transporter large permease subunit [Hellea sp.]|nr:TRAP transporter large permease subunit [Hellea sp.]
MLTFLALGMFAVACAALLRGYNVAFTLGGVGILFAAIGTALGYFDSTDMINLPGRIYPIITREILIAVPLFVFMGVMLEKSKIAEDLLESMGNLLGPMRGGLGVSVVMVGALLAASTGIVGATVVTMGLLSLPTMLKRNYAPDLASGAIAASGTLGQIIPPSIVLVILGDQMSNANQEAIRSHGADAGRVVSVGDLFAGALIPGLILVGLYALYIAIVAFMKPEKAPAQSWPQNVNPWRFVGDTLKAMLPPLLLIVAVLGSILLGYATPTRGAAIGALGAILLATYKTAPQTWARFVAVIAVASMSAMIAIDVMEITNQIALLLAAISMICVGLSLIPLLKSGQLAEVSRTTMHITCMVFVILIGATIFSLIFRGFGGDELVAGWLDAAPGGMWGAFALVMLVMFFLGFFLDFIEITFVVVPLVAPPLLAAGMDPVWLGILMALNLQTSFLTPPFGFALFYLRGVSPPEVTTTALYRGVIPFIAIQFIVILMVVFWPELATSLPEKMLN